MNGLSDAAYPFDQGHKAALLMGDGGQTLTPTATTRALYSTSRQISAR